MPWSVRWLVAVWMSLLLSGAGLVGCSSKESEPVAVARAFADASRRGDVDAMLAVLEQPALDRVREAAERASDQVGGRRSIEANEMLQIVGVDRTVAVSAAELLDEDGRTAHVQLTMTDGRTLVIELVWEQPVAADEGPGSAGGWKVRIPIPSDPAMGGVSVTPDA